MPDLINLHQLQGIPIKEVIDRQHSEIRRKRKNLRTAIVDGMGMDQIIACANDLIDTTLKHFESEEAAMEASGSEGVSTHKLMHAKIADSVQMIWSSLERRKVGDAMDLMKFFDEHLTYHLEFEDGAFGRELGGTELRK